MITGFVLRMLVFILSFLLRIEISKIVRKDTKISILESKIFGNSKLLLKLLTNTNGTPKNRSIKIATDHLFFNMM